MSREIKFRAWEKSSKDAIASGSEYQKNHTGTERYIMTKEKAVKKIAKQFRHHIDKYPREMEYIGGIIDQLDCPACDEIMEIKEATIDTTYYPDNENEYYLKEGLWNGVKYTQSIITRHKGEK